MVYVKAAMQVLKKSLHWHGLETPYFQYSLIIFIVDIIVRWLSTKMWTCLTKTPNFLFVAIIYHLRFKFLIGATSSMLLKKPSKNPIYL